MSARRSPVSLVAGVLFALAVARFALATYSGIIFLDAGDTPATVPNGFELLPTYYRGPTQYLTILPLMVFSYENLHRVLLPIYGLLIVATAYLTWRTLRAVRGAPVPWLPVFATTLAFTPLLVAYDGREFEVVIVAALAVAYWAAVQDRFSTLGAVVAYVSFYKYLPLLLVPYLVIRRWWRAVAAFAIAAAVILAAAQALFGLERFVNNNIPNKGLALVTAIGSSDAFCHPQNLLDGTLEDDDWSVRADLCRFSGSIPVPPPVAYALLLSITLGSVGYGALRIARMKALSPPAERWRRILELSLVVMVYTVFFFEHYYYLSVLVVPLCALIVRFTSKETYWRAGIVTWGLAYFFLGTFVVPWVVLDQLFGINTRALYTASPSMLLGEMIVLGLLLQQYVQLPAD